MKHWILGLFIVFTGFSFPQGAVAQEADGVTPYKLDEVVVTATRKEEKIKDLPGSVSVVTRAEIEQSDAKEVPELLQSIPGVTFQDNYSNGTQFSFGLRGVNPGRCNKVLVMVNGVPMNSGHTGTVFWRDLPAPDQIEKIEVVKGPVSALYGGFGIGGAVNIITRRGPVSNKATVKTDFGSDQEKRLSADIGGNLTEKFSYQVGYAYQEGDGWRDRSAFDAHKISGKLSYAISDRADIELDMGYVSNKHEVPGDITREQFEEDPTQAQSQIGLSDLDRVFANLVYHQDVGEDDNLRISWYYHQYDLDYMFASYRTGNYFYDVTTTGGEFQYTLNHSLFGLQNTMIFGPTIRFDTADVQSYTATPEGERTDTLKSDSLAEPMFWAIYVQDEIAVTDALKLSVGLRYDEARFENEDRLDSEDFDSVNMNAFSPKFGLSYRLFPHTTVFANVAKGFAPPTVSKLYGTSGNPDLDPESALNYEVSLRSAPVDWFDLTAAVYLMDVTDEIITVEVDGASKNVNAGETRHKGIETELNLHLPMGISPFANLTFQNVEFTDYKVYNSRTGTTDVYDGNTLPDVPDFKMVAGLRYHHSVGVTCSLSATYEDEKYTDEANQYEIPSFTVWDTRLEFRNKFKGIDYSVHASVRNIFDKTYFASGSGADVYPSSPRTFLVGVSFSY